MLKASAPRQVRKKTTHRKSLVRAAPPTNGQSIAERIVPDTTSADGIKLVRSKVGSFRMERGFWDYLDTIGEKDDVNHAVFVKTAEGNNSGSSTASATRSEILRYLRILTSDRGNDIGETQRYQEVKEDLLLN
jgi:predicted DNA-binding ribbon-helix-helix protein